MALVKFYRGNYEKYNKSTHADGVYFASDKQLIIMNGTEYGGVNLSQFDGFIKDVDVEGQKLTFKKDVVKDGVGSWENVSIELIRAGDESIELGNITSGNVTDGSTIKVKAVYDGNEDGDGLKLTDNGIKVVLDKTRSRLATIEGEETVDGSIKKALKDAKDYTDTEIQKLDVDEIGGTGKVVTTISETDGKISATAIDLVSTAVARTATVSSETKVAVSGTNVEEAIESLATSIKSTEKAAATYTVKKVTDGLASNIKEAYQLVETIDGTSKDVNVQIPVYKDSSLKDVELVAEDDKGKKGQFLKFTYITDEGKDKVVYLDVSKFLIESEFTSGLTTNEAGEVSVKIDTNSETFLTVSENGVKLSGVQDAINTAKAEVVSSASTEYNDLAKVENKIKEVDAKASAAHTQVNAKKDGHVTVAVETKKDASGITYSSVTVSENDIASESALTAEIAARKAVDGQSGQTYAANGSANYISGATSLNDADVKLDSALKSEADRAIAQENKVEASVGLATDGSHVATSGNYTSGATTVVGEIAALDAQVKKNADNIAAVKAAKVSVSASTDTESAKYLEVSSSIDASTSATTYTVKAKGIDDAIKTAIEDLDVDVISGANQVIASVSETDGKVSATTIDLSAENTTFAAVKDQDGKFDVDATNVQAAIEALDKEVYSALSWIEIE